VVPAAAWSLPATLLLEHFDSVAVLHVQGLGSVTFVDASSVKRKPDGLESQASSFAVGAHEFLEGGVAFDLELDDVPILAHHLEIDVLWIDGVLVFCFVFGSHFLDWCS